MNLRIDGSQRPHGLGPVQVGNGTQEMGQVLEEVGHSSTLVVDEQKGHIVWVEVDSQAQDIGLDSLRLPGSGCPGNEPVRSVSFFMQVEVD